MKQKIEKTHFPLTYTTQKSRDGSFSVKLPGKMFETTTSSAFKEYFYPEMINGAYYVISRINTYAPLIGQDQEHIYRRLDSLLFENIPGDILKKTKINKASHPGYDILNKTRRGDYQRYQIFITPLEIFIFKMG
ncbi:MAG: TraB/GumN family protein, partial [Bacteroidetes bacterium]|nr:TraB/GumN family protein [Bacteroidota bacterium]